MKVQKLDEDDFEDCRIFNPKKERAKRLAQTIAGILATIAIIGFLAYLYGEIVSGVRAGSKGLAEQIIKTIDQK